MFCGLIAFVNALEALAILAIIASDVAGAVLLAILCKPCGVLVEGVGAIIGGFLGLGVGLAGICLIAKLVTECWRVISGNSRRNNHKSSSM